MEKLPEDFKKKWLEALRSGEYKQGVGTLYDKVTNAHCCIGVACYLHNGVNANLCGFLPQSGVSGYSALPDAISGGFSNDVTAQLITMNDSGKSFAEIADWIEKNL